MKEMNRKEFLRKSLPALALMSGASITSCSSEKSKTGADNKKLPVIRWRMPSSFPRGLDTIFGGAEIFAKAVRELTDDRFRIHPYPPGEIVPGLQVLDAVQQGISPIGHTAGYYYTGKHAALAFDSGVPFGLTARQQNAWIEFGGGKEVLQKVYDRFNLIALPAGNTGTQMGGWFRKPVNSLADMKGLKMRIPGLGGKVMAGLGVSVQVLAGADIYPALERGAIDATEWVGPYDDEKLGFHRVAKYYYSPGWWEPSTQVSIYINKDEFQKLPESYRNALRIAAGFAQQMMLARYDYLNPLALKRIVKSGVELRNFPEDFLIEARKKSAELLEKQAKEDSLYREVYTSWKKFREEAFEWSATNELAYQKIAFQKEK